MRTKHNLEKLAFAAWLTACIKSVRGPQNAEKQRENQ